jgi:CRISPR type III-B/RAMP module-associated protein Cmr3
MGGSDAGDGGQWPLPSTFHSAMMSAFYDKWPTLQEDFEHRHSKNEKDKNQNSSFRFGGLKTAGPFPQKNGKIYLPFPADLAFDEKDNSNTAELIKWEKGHSDMPSFLEYSVANTIPPTKKEVPQWLDSKRYEKYLEGKAIKEIEEEPLLCVEPRPGIGIDRENRSTEEGQFYQAEYLRLARDVCMTAFAECETVSHSEKGKERRNLLEMFFEKGASKSFVFGGQRGMAYMDCERSSCPMDKFCDIGSPEKSDDGFLLKWILISPAVFSKGWLPNWVDSKTGKVLLKSNTPDRRSFRTRKEWREKIENLDDIKAKLVAARFNKPVAFSGWREHGGAKAGPKPTMMAVPAGSVYYFRAESANDALALSRQLTGRRRSDFMGEQGFGLGICSFKNIKIKTI